MNKKTETICPMCFDLYRADEIKHYKVFADARALSLHLGGKARAGDEAHRNWIRTNCGDIEFKTSDLFRDTNRIAQIIHPKVIHHLAQQRQDPRGWMFPLVIECEVMLRDLVKKTLKDHLGDTPDRWWFDGVPEKIRVQCATLFEKDKGKTKERYEYAYIIDLLEIIFSHWGWFLPHFKKYGNGDKKTVGDMIRRLNDIRNQLAHSRAALEQNNCGKFLVDLRSTLKSINPTDSEHETDNILTGILRGIKELIENREISERLRVCLNELVKILEDQVQDTKKFTT